MCRTINASWISAWVHWPCGARSSLLAVREGLEQRAPGLTCPSPLYPLHPGLLILLCHAWPQPHSRAWWKDPRQDFLRTWGSEKEWEGPQSSLLPGLNERIQNPYARGPSTGDSEIGKDALPQRWLN